MGKLQDCVTEVESQVGPNTNFHLFLYQKIASLQVIQRDLGAVEDTFKKCVDIAENSKVPLNANEDSATNIFMWQNNLLKFYLEHDIDKAIVYGTELTEEVSQILPQQAQDDLKFSLATSYALKGDLRHFDTAKQMFTECLWTMPDAQKGFVENNLGMWHFFNFVRMSSELKDPQGAGADAIQPVIDNFEATIKHLKSSIRSFEMFDSVFENLAGKDQQALEQQMAEGEQNKGHTQIPLAHIKAKLFSEEFFSLEPPGELLPKNWKHYDLMKNAENEQLLQMTIKNSSTIQPIQNLGEVAFIMQQHKESFAFLDMALKLYKVHEMQNLLKFKVLTLLGSLLETQGDTPSM